MLKLIKSNQKNFLAKLDIVLKKRKLKDSKIDLKVSISPNTLAVSATVRGVEELKCPCFFPAKYW